ncbi:MAG: FN3 associated domain-containing protein [Clostridia bacterium]|nr:FN3 associated domain-containing protein [Clostridia bacterium]
MKRKSAVIFFTICIIFNMLPNFVLAEEERTVSQRIELPSVCENVIYENNTAVKFYLGKNRNYSELASAELYVTITEKDEKASFIGADGISSEWDGSTIWENRDDKFIEKADAGISNIRNDNTSVINITDYVASVMEKDETNVSLMLFSDGNIKVNISDNEKKPILKLSFYDSPQIVFAESLIQKIDGGLLLAIGYDYFYIGTEKRNLKTAVYNSEGNSMVSAEVLEHYPGAAVEINDELGLVNVKTGKDDLIFYVGDSYYSKNGTKTYMGKSAEYKDGVICLPIRGIAKALSKNISWDERGLIAFCDNADVFKKITNMDTVANDAFGIVKSANTFTEETENNEEKIEDSNYNKISANAVAQITKSRPTETLGWAQCWPNTYKVCEEGNPGYVVMNFPFGNKNSPDSIGRVYLNFHVGSLAYVDNDWNGRTSGSLTMHGMKNGFDSKVTWNKMGDDLIKTSSLWRNDTVTMDWIKVDVTDYVISEFEEDNNAVAFAFNGSAAIDSLTSGNAPYLEVEWKSSPERNYSNEIQKILINSGVFYKDSGLTYIDNVPVYLDDKDVFVRTKVADGKFYIPKSFAERVYPSSIPETDNIFSGLEYSSLDKIAEKLGYFLQMLDENTCIISSDIDVLNKLNDEQKTAVKYAKWGKYNSVQYVSHEGLPEAGKHENAEEQKKRFEDRNSPENLKKLADKFFGMMKLDKPELSSIKNAYESGDYELAFAMYSKRFLEVLYGNTRIDSISKPNNTTADDLYNGIKTVAYLENNKTLTERTYIGEPGEVNWSYKVAWNNSDMNANCDMVVLGTYQSLLNEAYASGNVAYVRKWFEYMDDLALNTDLFNTKPPFDSGNNASSFYGRLDALAMFSTLKKASNSFTKDAGAIPGASLARLLCVLIEYFEPYYINYVSAMDQNWSITTSGFSLEAANIYQDFKYADYLTGFALEHAQSYLEQMDYIDGVERQKSFNYDAMLLQEYTQNNNIAMEKYVPEYWEKNKSFFLERLWDRANFNVRTKQNNGTFFANGSLEFNVTMAGAPHHGSWGYIPELFEEENTSKVLAATMGEKRSVPYVEPEFTSDSFPYSGYYIVRDGWDDNAQQVMFAAHDVDDSLNQGVNNFTLKAFDQNLLTYSIRGYYSSGIQYTYSKDGLFASPASNIISTGHQSVHNHLTNKVLPWRNHTSSSFDYIEGRYNGHFADYLVWGFAKSASEQKKLVDETPDTAFDRNIQFVRDLGIWIVTDKINAEKAHDFGITYRIFCKPKDNEPPDEGVKIINIEDISANGNVVKSDTEGMANISMYRFSSVPFEIKNDIWTAPGSGHGSRNYNTYNTTAYFRDVGKSTHINVIYPRENIEDELKNVEELKDNASEGVKITVDDNNIVYFKTAVDGTAVMLLGDIKAECEQIMYQETEGNGVKGMALGCTMIRYKDKTMDRQGVTDFEFVENENGEFTLTPIYKPLNIPEITPVANAFSGSAVVKMSHELGNAVDIIYTTDGTEPTLESETTLKYTGPFVISDTCTVKARAVRKGVTETPKTMAATHMSYAAVAYYTKQEMKPAIDIDSSKLKNGLRYKYYSLENYDWGKAMANANGFGADMNYDSEGEGKLFDISTADWSKPFGYDYEGYFYVEQSGDYTFTMPEETWRDEMNAGYWLNIVIDGEKSVVSMRRHSMGKWTISLEKGYHDIKIYFADVRGEVQYAKIKHNEWVEMKIDRNNPVPNFGTYNINQYLWNGKTPEVYIEGPNLNKQLLPDSMFYYKTE